MTRDEIKQSVSMRDVVERYGIRINRNGFCKCPFHLEGNERTASMKIYKDSFHCFGCGANGDIFTFVEMAEKCDFKAAYQILGGNYGPMDKMANMRQYRTKKAMSAKRTKEDILRDKMRRNMDEIQFCLMIIEKAEPLSDVWCYCINQIERLRYRAEELEVEWEGLNNGTSGGI